MPQDYPDFGAPQSVLRQSPLEALAREGFPLIHNQGSALYSSQFKSEEDINDWYQITGTLATLTGSGAGTIYGKNSFKLTPPSASFAEARKYLPDLFVAGDKIGLSVLAAMDYTSWWSIGIVYIKNFVRQFYRLKIDAANKKIYAIGNNGAGGYEEKEITNYGSALDMRQDQSSGLRSFLFRFVLDINTISYLGVWLNDYSWEVPYECYYDTLLQPDQCYIEILNGDTISYPKPIYLDAVLLTKDEVPQDVYDTPEYTADPGIAAKMTAWWDMEENGAGDRIDETGGGYDLTPDTSLSAQAAKVGNGCRTPVGNQLQDVAASLVFGSSQDWCFGGWFYTYTEGCVFTKGYDTSGKYEFKIRLHSGSTFRVQVSADGTTNTVLATPTPKAYINVWTYIFVWYDSVANQFNFKVDNDLGKSYSYGIATIHTDSLGFMLGEQEGGGNSSDMLFDSWFVALGNILTQDEQDFIYNSGYGRQFSDL